MTGEWYFERWKADGEAAFISHTTKDFSLVLLEAAAAVATGEIFRVRPPIGTPDEELRQLSALGTFERI
jgi:hypothetical protein